MIKLIRVILIFIPLIKLCQSCAVIIDHPIEIEIKKNIESPWFVIISDITVQGLFFYRGISYGSLIHPEMVLTAAQPLQTYILNSDDSQKNLRVSTDCSVGSRLQSACVDRKVPFIVDLANFEERATFKESDWALLLLNKPFELNKRVNTINFADGDDDFDRRNCVIYHWGVKLEGQYREHGLEYVGAIITSTYRVSLADDETFGVNKEDEVNKIPIDGDCMVGTCNVSRSEPKITAADISFMGSPVVCRLKNNSSQSVQVGFATIVYRVYDAFKQSSEYEQLSGTLIDLTPNITQIKSIISEFFVQ